MGKINFFDNEISYDNFYGYFFVKSKDSLLYVFIT